MLCRANASNVSQVGLDVPTVSVLFSLTGGVSFVGRWRARIHLRESKVTPPSLVYTPSDLTRATWSTRSVARINAVWTHLAPGYQYLNLQQSPLCSSICCFGGPEWERTGSCFQSEKEQSGVRGCSLGNQLPTLHLLKVSGLRGRCGR